MRLHKLLRVILLPAFFFMSSCSQKPSCHEEMKAILSKLKQNLLVTQSEYSIDWKLSYVDSLLNLKHTTPDQVRFCKYLKANILLEIGREEEAVKFFEEIVSGENPFQAEKAKRQLATAYLRLGERANCISNHASASCIMPVRGLGIHKDTTGSQKAIEILKALVTKDPGDLESAWLLNIAYMTLGKYPEGVPPALLIPGMEGDVTHTVNAFEDIASDLKLDVKNMAGGSIVDDFDNDGYLDIVTSGWSLDEEMHYFKNAADGTFTDITDKVGLSGITGGLNIMQADYNNDGFKDILVLRGAWKEEAGQEPNSLLKNNGDGTFTDVTTESGILSFHPTQTATWNDFNNDGWLDVFIGNETSLNKMGSSHPCELYINNQDGTFQEIAAKAHCDILNFVKAVTSGDYDNDGWKDIFISTMDGKRKLLRNQGLVQNEISFADMTSTAGLDNEKGRTFPAWFWDYDNDGWLDIFACDYTFDRSLAYYAAAEKLNMPAGNPEKMLLYHNNQNGTFTNVADELGLTKNVFAMGSNFGDIDNDGFLDMYLGTGNPMYQSLIPNKMFKNLGGKQFVDVTTSARVGHLQKGHGVSFADMDNDGDQDIYIEMGGAYPGDAYQNSFFLNPGQGDNKWICLVLEGSVANRSAIGSRVKLTFTENGRVKSVYRDVNSGGSFGASPLRREIGIGQATMIDEIEIQWHGSSKVQTFRNVKPNQFLKIVEGKDVIERIPLKTLNWVLPDRLCDPTTLSMAPTSSKRFNGN